MHSNISIWLTRSWDHNGQRRKLFDLGQAGYLMLLRLNFASELRIT
jgi:hypothetical protein